MSDDSLLDQKYFIDDQKYNCPFCNRRHVTYRITHVDTFDWTDKKKCHIIMVICNSCYKSSMHLTFERIVTGLNFSTGINIDDKLFYSVPTSFFTVDTRIKEKLRELITEAEGCLKMNYLTGASACIRKAIYEFLVLEGAKGKSYDDRIKEMKGKFPAVEPEYFDELSHLQSMSSDKIHESSWEDWDSPKIKLLLETLRNIFYEIYVLPDEKKQKRIKIQKLREEVSKPKKSDDKITEKPNVLGGVK